MREAQYHSEAISQKPLPGPQQNLPSQLDPGKYFIEEKHDDSFHKLGSVENRFVDIMKFIKDLEWTVINQDFFYNGGLKVALLPLRFTSSFDYFV